MYTKITRSGGRKYLQLVEGYRNDEGKVRHRVVANLGRLEDLNPAKLDPLINGLNRAIGRSDSTAFPVEIESSKAYGNVFALHELWKDLGFDRALGRAMRSGRRKIEADALVRAMVFNRLCDPTSKLGCLRWLDTVAIPEMPPKVEHHHLLRAMDALMDNVDRVETELAKQIRPLVDRDLTVVFYDLTTVRIHGEGEVDDDIRAYGMNKETGGIARQFVLGVVQTAEGLPLMHTVHPGNVAETKTLQAMLATVLQRFPIERVILVADRGLLSLDNIDALTSLAEQDGRTLEFILAVPARRYSDLVETFRDMDFDEDRLAEDRFAGHRLIVAHDPLRAVENRATGAGRASPSSTPWPRKWSASSTPRMPERPPRDAAPPTAGRIAASPVPSRRPSSPASSRPISMLIGSAGRSMKAPSHEAELFDGKLALITNAPDLTPPRLSRATRASPISSAAFAC